MTRIFFSNYHISVNRPLVEDLVACGLEVVMPDGSFPISFFAPNDQHRDIARIVSRTDWSP